MNESKYGSADAVMSGAMSAGASPVGTAAAAGTVADMGASGAADVSGVNAAAGETGTSAAAAAVPEAGMPAPAAAGAGTSAQGAASPASAAAGVQDAASAAVHGGEAADGLAAAAGKGAPQGAQALSERAERLSAQQANRTAALGQLESAKNAKPPVDEKYLYMFAAIQDEWKKFMGSKDYDALPESALDALDPEKDERRRHASGKASYRTTARQTLEAAERYRLQGNSDTAGGAAGALVDLSAGDAAGTPGRGY